MEPRTRRSAITFLHERRHERADPEKRASLLRMAHENSAEMGEEVRTGLRRILSVPHIAIAIWSAAIATPIQYRQLLETRRCRAFLIQLGIEEASLRTQIGFDRARIETISATEAFLSVRHGAEKLRAL